MKGKLNLRNISQKQRKKNHWRNKRDIEQGYLQSFLFWKRIVHK